MSWEISLAAEVALLRQWLPGPGQQVLEMGAGDGRLTHALAGEATRWVALDTDLTELAASRAGAGIPAAVRFVLGDGRYLPLPTAAFDLVFFSWSLC